MLPTRRIEFTVPALGSRYARSVRALSAAAVQWKDDQSMLNITTKKRIATFVLAVRNLRSRLRLDSLRSSHLQLGIAGRLAISFLAVAALAVVANLIVEGKVSVLQTTEIRHERAVSEDFNRVGSRCH